MGIERRISYEAHLNLKLIPVWGKSAYKMRISLFFLYLYTAVCVYGLVRLLKTYYSISV